MVFSPFKSPLPHAAQSSGYIKLRKSKSQEIIKSLFDLSKIHTFMKKKLQNWVVWFEYLKILP